MQRLTSPARRGPPALRLALLAAILLAVACKGDPKKPNPTVIGSDGGTVTEPGGATVSVPPGAVEAEVTIRVAKDSTGAPAVPEGLGSAGDTYAITPHGAEFAEPVEIRIPAPAVTLQPNQELKLAKAELGGEWVVLGDSALSDGVLTAHVKDFSFFMPVTVTYLVPLAQLAPFQGTTSVSCGGQSCGDLAGPVTATLTVTTNNGQLPEGCFNDGIVLYEGESSRNLRHYGRALPFSGGTLVWEIPSQPARWILQPVLRCTTQQIYVGAERALDWRRAFYPALQLARMPASLDVVAGRTARLEVILIGGASKLLLAPDTYAVPTTADRAVADWQRSDDGGASWRTVARSYQDEANPDPLDAPAWRYWSVSHGFVAQAADHDALLRVLACYTPPDVPAPPCITTPPTLLHVVPPEETTPPFIVDVPRSVLVQAGQTASFSATVGGTPAPNVRWETRVPGAGDAWTDVAVGTGAATLNYTTLPVSLADNGREYRIVAVNVLGAAASPPVTVSVSDVAVPPSVTTQPASITVQAGSDAVFAIAARGTEALSYAWFHGDVAIAGANGPVLRLAAVTAAAAGSYHAVVANGAGTATSDPATLAIGAGPSAVPPAIVTQPASLLVDAGVKATFEVGATGEGLRYQWSRNLLPVPGATEASYTTPVATVADDGAAFSVLVFNGAGLVFSQAAILGVKGLGTPGMALFVGDFVLGGGGGSADAVGKDARLDTPEALVSDAAGNLYVAESNAAKVAKIAPDARVTTLFHHTHSVTAIALGPDGSLYVGAQCGMPRLLPPLVAGATNQPVHVGFCPAGLPRGLDVDGAGAVRFSVPGVNAIMNVVVSGTSATFPVFVGAPSGINTPGTSDGNGTSARFRGQRGVARGADGTLYVADTDNHTIRRVTPQGDVTTWIGVPGEPGNLDGIGDGSLLYRPAALAFDAAGNLFVLTLGDPANPVALVRRITPGGGVTTLFNATEEVLALATAAEAPWARLIRGMAVLGVDRVALSAGNAIVVRTLSGSNASVARAVMR